MTQKQKLNLIVSKFNKDLGKIIGSNFKNMKLIKKFIEEWNPKRKKK